MNRCANEDFVFEIFTHNHATRICEVAVNCAVRV